MTAKRTPTGKPNVGEQINQKNILTGLLTFTGNGVVNTGRIIQSKSGNLKDVVPYAVIGLKYEDNGSSAGTNGARLSSVDNGDGTFTVYSEKTNFGGSTWIPATAACTVRWTALITR